MCKLIKEMVIESESAHFERNDGAYKRSETFAEDRNEMRKREKET